MVMTYIYNKVERIWKWGLCVCLTALMPVTAHADTYGIQEGNTWHQKYVAEGGASSTFTGEGTMASPYLIETAWDLCRLEYNVNQGEKYTNIYFKLVNDIDLADHDWYPIGVSEPSYFAGIFDGNGKTISNMQITLTKCDEMAVYGYGLFGFMYGIIRNLNMTNANITIKRDENDNTFRMLYAGLMCAYMDHYESGPSEPGGVSVYGAAYGCNIQGTITGKNKQNGDYWRSYAGGVVGFITNPVSIFRTHADVTINVTDVANVGGIVGLTEPFRNAEYATASEDHPNQAYIFDCTAHVNLSSQKNHAGSTTFTCGGICGNSFSDIVACGATGTIVGNTGTGNFYGGGIVGTNRLNIIDCVSMVNISNCKMAGGIVGTNANLMRETYKVNDNEKDYIIINGNVANCVYSGHIDVPASMEGHGILGTVATDTRAFKPVNCLFLGTMKNASTSKAPLCKEAINNSYCDQNMYDDYSEDESNDYLTFSELTSGIADHVSFQTKIDYCLAWKALQLGVNNVLTVLIGAEDVDINHWQFEDGFYPRLQLSGDNFVKNNTTIKDYAILRAAKKFGEPDDGAFLYTPALFPAYAWIASVPIGINNGLLAHFMDGTLSLSKKQQVMDNEGNMKTATFSLPSDQTLLTVSDEKATPKPNFTGDVMLTVTTTDNVTKQLCLNVNGNRQWDEKLALTFDGGNGTAESPYLIHNARQLMTALAYNDADEHYQLVNDIWFNENLLTNNGEPAETASKWDQKSSRDWSWKAHLDGNGHLIRGMYSTNAFGLIGEVSNGASIENCGFVDCLVWSPEADPVDDGTILRPLGFLTPKIGATAKVSNCLFDGVVKERRNNTDYSDFGAFIHTIDAGSQTVSSPVIEDCVISVAATSEYNHKPFCACVVNIDGANDNTVARRVLVLNNSWAMSGMATPDANIENCYYPAGYLKQIYDNTGHPQPDARAKATADMTEVPFFTGTGFDKWTQQAHHFPMLATFAETAYGKLISLPVMTSESNSLDNINYLLDFVPGPNTVSWQTTDNTVVNIDTDVNVLEPLTASSQIWVVRSMDEDDGTTVKTIMPVYTAISSDITTGIRFTDDKAKNFCLAHYDGNHDNVITLSELKALNFDTFQGHMRASGNFNGDDISKFPEFRFFSKVDALGTSFQQKTMLEQLTFPGKITALSDDAFKGTTSMTAFTVPAKIKTLGAHPFDGSGLKDYDVDADNTVFAAADGLLMDADKEQLLSYPNGRKGSITIPGNVTEIASNAIYKVPEADSVFVSAADYDYETVVSLNEGAVVHATTGKDMLYFIKDATEEALLFNQYQNDNNWSGKTLDRYFELDVSEKSTDRAGNYWATMYIGWDTDLPDALTPYIVDSEKTQNDSPTLVLRKISHKLPALTPVVIRADKAGKYKLYPAKGEPYSEFPMSENLLEGVNKDGKEVYQSDSNDGGCLTLGRNSNGEVGFFIYKGTAKIPAFRAFLTVNKVAGAKALTFTIDDDEAAAVQPVGSRQEAGASSSYYNLKGQHVAQPSKGVYINNGHVIIKK